MYSKRSPPTVPAGIEFPNISMPGRRGIAPSTGINRSRKYSPIFGTVFVFVMGEASVNLVSDSATADRAARYRFAVPSILLPTSGAPVSISPRRDGNDRGLAPPLHLQPTPPR